MDGQRMRMALIEMVRELSRVPDYSLSQTQVLARVSEQLGIRGASPAKKAEQEALLTVWYDLFREGYLSWGVDMSNPDPPHCHLTDMGRRFLARMSRDPGNHEGYMHYLTSATPLNPVALSYIDEALRAYRAGCYKAAAVMAGAATESLVLEVRNTVTARLDSPGVAYGVSAKTRKELDDWVVKRVLEALKTVLDAHKGAMPRDLQEAYAGYWDGFSHHARLMRNDAGHPSGVNPVREETVHAALLMYPTHAQLAADLVAWIPGGIA